MRRFFPLLTLITLVACTPATAPTDPSADRVMEGTGIMVRLEQNITEDAQGIPNNKAVLHITGVVEKDIDLGAVQGELSFVDPASYPVYAEQENQPEIVGMYTTWFAGQGEEISLQIFNQHLMVMRRMGDEQNVCTKLEELANIPLGQDVVIEWNNDSSLKTVAQSSIAFCDQQ